jgi:hypothetical protein
MKALKLKLETQSTKVNKEHWEHKLRYTLKSKTLQLLNERIDTIETQNVYNNNCSSTNTRALTKSTYSKHQLKAILRALRAFKGECKKKEKNGEAWRWHSKLQNNEEWGGLKMTFQVTKQYFFESFFINRG